VCCAGSRLLVQESVAEKLYKKIKARMETLRMGNSLDKSIDIGAVVDGTQLKTIQTMVQLGVDEGSTLNQPSWLVQQTAIIIHLHCLPMFLHRQLLHKKKYLDLFWWP